MTRAFPSLLMFLRIALISIEQEVKKESESWRKYLPFPSIKRISFNIHPVVLLCLIGSASPKDGSPPALTTTSLTHLVLQITHSLTHSQENHLGWRDHQVFYKCFDGSPCTMLRAHSKIYLIYQAMGSTTSRSLYFISLFSGC